MVLLLGGAQIPDQRKGPLTAAEVIDRIKAEVTCPWSEETVDTFKSGDPATGITGIACTFTATVEVLKRAADLGCNLVITHEPTFYNHLDEVSNFEGDPVYRSKKKLLDDMGMVVFRFHDHWHRTAPDGIYAGMIDKLQWGQCLVQGEERVFQFPERSLSEMAGYLREVFPEAIPRVIGDPEMRIHKAAFIAGAPGSMDHIRMLRRDDIDVIIIGEAREWETVEYVRDAVQLGMQKAMIILGHVVSEEEGMHYCAQWLYNFIDEVPVYFVEAGDPFHH